MFQRTSNKCIEVRHISCLIKSPWEKKLFTRTNSTYNEDKCCHSRLLLVLLQALNVYQINLYQHYNFINRLKSSYIPELFYGKTKKPINKYWTNFFDLNYHLKKYFLKTRMYSVSFRWSRIEIEKKEIFEREDKETNSHLLFEKHLSQS